MNKHEDAFIRALAGIADQNIRDALIAEHAQVREAQLAADKAANLAAGRNMGVWALIVPAVATVAGLIGGGLARLLIH